MKPTDLFQLQNKPTTDINEEQWMQETIAKRREIAHVAIMWIQEHGYGVMWDGKQFVTYDKRVPQTDETQWHFDNREDAYRKALELIDERHTTRAQSEHSERVSSDSE
jgi:hypothetical protein